MEIVINVFMALSYLIFWITRFAKYKKHLALTHSLAQMVRVVSFTLTGNINGIENSIITISRNMFASGVRNKPLRYRRICLEIYLGIMWSAYLLAFNGIQTYFILGSGTVTAAGFFLGREQTIRSTGMIGSALYTGFMWFSGQTLGAVLECITFVSFVVSFVWYLKHPIEQKNSM